mgnify:CR=1 FL=1
MGKILYTNISWKEPGKRRFYGKCEGVFLFARLNDGLFSGLLEGRIKIVRLEKI